MAIKALNIHHLRLFFELKLEFDEGINIITGPNGSGKTSILEALYLISTGRSFRAHEAQTITSHQQKELTLFAIDDQNHRYALSRISNQSTKIRIDGRTCLSSSELAYALPCQCFYQDMFAIIDAGSTLRRSMIDWGMFHVEHTYLKLYKDYKRILKHRNLLLKQKAPYSNLIPWDEQLSEVADKINQLRQNYVDEWRQVYKQYLTQLVDFDCDFEYQCGWSIKKNQNLLDVLKSQYDSDIHKGYTQSGPHQADLIIKSDGVRAKKVLSRGEQKMILFAMKLAQTDMLKKPCMLLIDDLQAELDSKHIEKLVKLIISMNGQKFITSILGLNIDIPHKQINLT